MCATTVALTVDTLTWKLTASGSGGTYVADADGLACPLSVGEALLVPVRVLELLRLSEAVSEPVREGEAEPVTDAVGEPDSDVEGVGGGVALPLGVSVGVLPTVGLPDRLDVCDGVWLAVPLPVDVGDVVTTGVPLAVEVPVPLRVPDRVGVPVRSAEADSDGVDVAALL